MRSRSAWLAMRAARVATWGSSSSRTCMISAGLVSAGAPSTLWRDGLGEERSASDVAGDQPLVFQVLQGAAHGGAGRGQLLDQGPFGGQLRPRTQGAALGALNQELPQ